MILRRQRHRDVDDGSRAPPGNRIVDALSTPDDWREARRRWRRRLEPSYRASAHLDVPRRWPCPTGSFCACPRRRPTRVSSRGTGPHGIGSRSTPNLRCRREGHREVRLTSPKALGGCPRRDGRAGRDRPPAAVAAPTPACPRRPGCGLTRNDSAVRREWPDRASNRAWIGHPGSRGRGRPPWLMLGKLSPASRGIGCAWGW